MTRTTLACGLMVLCVVGLSPINANGAAQITLYFDPALQHRIGDCPNYPPGTVLDTLYVAASGFEAPLEGIEFKVALPPQITWLVDVPLFNSLQIDASPNGTSIAFPNPVDASSLVAVHAMLVVWNCQYCTQYDVPVSFEPHPVSGGIRAVTSDLEFVDLVAMGGYVCPSIAALEAEETGGSYRVRTRDQAVEQCVIDCPAGDGGVVLPGTLPAEIHSPDFDGNDQVDEVDYEEFANAYQAAFDANYDLYCSDNLDLRDFVLFTRHVLHTAPVQTESTTWGRIKAMFPE